MRTASLAFVVAVSALGACAEPPRSHDGKLHHVTIGVDALETAREVVGRRQVLEVLEVGEEAAVIELDDADLEALSEQMHERHDRCGGFMVHESLEEARAELRAAAVPVIPALPAIPVIPGAADKRGYTLDQAAVVQDVLPALDEARIRRTIEELSAMQNRYYQSETGAAASRWLQARWRSFSAREDVTVELFDHGYAQQSVILTIPGTTRASEVVVIGGHLDSIAVGGRDSKAPGADDDASGIATLTEVARVLLARDVRPARTIQMIAYAAEEVGLRGSLSIVREYKRRGVNVVGALQLDMTNYQGSDRDIWLMRDYTSAEQNQFLTRLIDAYVGATWGYDSCGYACSDHASWHRAGIPASMPFESRSSERNRKIHTAKDTLETSGNNAAHAVKFARLAAAYAIELAKTAPAADAAAADAAHGAPAATAADAAQITAAGEPTRRCAAGTDWRAIAAVLGLLLAIAAQRALLARA